LGKWNWEIGKLPGEQLLSYMTEKELKLRTRRFAIDILNFVDKLPNRRSGNIIGNQLGRSASSVASNYRAACRARSHAEFISKIGIVEEEADESTFWLDIISETENSTVELTRPLLNEARELTAIFTATSKTAKQNKASKISQFPNPKIPK
jgi:four helix bundle protein